ncbi:Hypothetical protein GLP15_36 [Giardia lamblia P15]|uniref:Uncharacterized protein n=1 Tax=Giardia intestinalis (strain P15) TaxID=658858 RepID=E1F0Q0_GIAIA|nr:Hypothetical protein GLP15_36 [Giardia lamblia P15]
MPPLVSQFGRQRANINAGGMPITYRDDYDPRPQSKTKRPPGTTGSTYQTRTGTRVQNLQPAKSKQQLIRRPVAPQRRTITSNIFQLATALQAAKGTVGTPRREAKSVGDRPTYQVSKFIDRRTATRRQEPSDSYSDYYSYYSDSYPSDYFDDLVTSRSLSQRGASGSKDTSFAMLDDLIELIKENSISSQHSRDSRDNQSTRSKTKGKKSSSTSAFKQPSRASQSNSRSTSKSDQKAHKKAFSLADSQQEGSEHEFDSVIHQSLSTSQNSINTEIVIPNTKVSRGSMNFIEHNRMMAVHPYNAANSSKKDSILNSGQEKRTSYMENGLAGSTTGFINESRRHQQIRRKQAQDTNSNEDNSNRRHRTTGTPDLSIITGSAGSLAAPLISSAIATSGGADLSIDAGSHAVMSSVAPLVSENKELQVNYSEAQSHNNLTDKPARRYMLLKDSEKYRLTVQQQQQQQQQHMIQPKVQQPVLSHSALLTSGGPAEAPSEKVNVNTSGLSVRATPNSSALVMPHQLPGETPLPKYITTANDAFNLFRDKYRNLKQEKKALEKELAELKATLETERSELIAARQQIRHLESTKAEMRNEFRAILDEKEKIIYQLNTTVDQAHRIAIDRSLLDRSSADGGDIKLSAQPPVDTEAIYREAYEQAKIELLRELRQDLSVELEHQRAKRRGKEGDIELALSNLVTNKQCSENAIVGIKEPAKPIVSRVSNESSDIDYLKKGKKPTLATRSECTQEHNSLDSEKKDEADKSSEEAVPSRSPLITIPISTPITSKSTASTTKAMKDLTAQALVVSERDQSAQSGESSPMTLSPNIYKDPLRGISLHSKPPPPHDRNTQNELQEEVHKLVVVDNEVNSADGSNAVTTVVALQKETISTEANVVCTLENLQLKEFARVPDATVSEESVLPEEKETKSVTSVPRLPSEQSLNNHLLDEEIHNIEDTKEDKPEGQWNSTLEPQLESNSHAKADCALDEKQGDNIYYMQIQTHTKLLEHEEFAPNDHIDQEQDTGACEDRLSEVNTEELNDLTPAMTLPSNDRAKLINAEKLEVKDWEGDEAKREEHNELPHHMNVDSHVNVDTKSAGVTESIDVLDASTLMSGVVPDISEILADHTIQNLSMLPTPSGVSFMPRTEEHTGSEVALRDDGSAYMELTAAIDNIIDDSYYGNFIVIFMNMSEYPEGGEALCQLGVNMANCIYANASIELNAISQFEPLSKELLELVHDQHSVLWSMSYYTAKVLLAYFCAFGTDTLELITAIAPDFAVVLTEVSPDMGEGFANECHVLGALLSLIASLGVLCTEGDLASFIQASQTLLNLMKIDDCPIYLYPIPVTIVICIEVLLTNGYFLPLEADDDTKDEASILQENVTEVVATTLVKLCKKYLNQVQAGDSDEFLPEQHELCNIACLMQSTILLQREVRLKPELLENVQAVFEGVAQSTRALASVPGLSQYYEVVSSSKS